MTDAEYDELERTVVARRGRITPQMAFALVAEARGGRTHERWEGMASRALDVLRVIREALGIGENDDLLRLDDTLAEVRRLRAPQYLAARLRHQREQASRFDGLDEACGCADCALTRGDA